MSEDDAVFTISVHIRHREAITSSFGLASFKFESMSLSLGVFNAIRNAKFCTGRVRRW